MAGRTFHSGHESLNFLFHPLRIGLSKTALQIVDNALEIVHITTGTTVCLADHFQFFTASSVEKRIDGFFAHFADRGVQCKSISFAQSNVVHFADGSFRIVPTAGFDSAFANGELFVGKNQCRVHFHEGTQSSAGFTSTERIVEGEHTGRKFIDGNSVIRAGVALTEQHFFSADHVNTYQATGQTDGCFQRICQTGVDISIQNKAVDYDFHRVFFVFLQ